VGTVVSGSATRYLARRFEVDLHSRLNLDILRHIDAMAFVRFEDPRFHDALRRAQESPEVHVARCLTFTLELLTKAIQVLSLMAILFVIEPTLFLLLIPVGIPYLLFHWRLSRRQFEEIDAQVKNQRWIGYYTGVLSGVEHAAEIKLLGLAPLFIERCRVRMAAFRDLRAQYQRFEFFGNLIFALFSVIAIYIAMSRAAFSIVHGQLTIGDLAIYGSAAAQLRALVEGSVWQPALGYPAHRQPTRLSCVATRGTSAWRSLADVALRRRRVSQRDVYLSRSRHADAGERLVRHRAR
jgi:ATP-binding cassette subfamily B protein